MAANRWDILTGTSLNGIKPTERTVTSSTYAIAASNRMKLKSASLISLKNIVAWTKSTCWMEERIAVDS